MIKKIVFVLTILFFSTLVISFAQEETVPEETIAEEASESTEPQQLPEETAETAEFQETEVLPETAPGPPLDKDTLVWAEDNLPKDATTAGEWTWVQDIKFSGRSSHTDGIKKGLHFHYFKTPVPITLNKDSIIEQFVYLDLNNPPRGIMLKLIALDGEDIDLYWEAEEEVFVDAVEYMKAWYMGFLPEAGSWQKLVIKMQEVEVTSLELIGISFITFDGRSYWDRTVIKNS